MDTNDLNKEELPKKEYYRLIYYHEICETIDQLRKNLEDLENGFEDVEEIGFLIKRLREMVFYYNKLSETKIQPIDTIPKKMFTQLINIFPPSL